MISTKKIIRFILWLGVVLLQLIMTQAVTFVVSMPFPRGMENYPQNHPIIFVLVLVISFTTGVFYTGWVAIRRRWITLKPKYLARLVFTLVGAIVPLLVALIFYHPLEPGNPFFFVSMFTSVVGFYIPGWIQFE
jgi:uncharacterized protein YacL